MKETLFGLTVIMFLAWLWVTQSPGSNEYEALSRARAKHLVEGLELDRWELDLYKRDKGQWRELKREQLRDLKRRPWPKQALKNQDTFEDAPLPFEDAPLELPFSDELLN